MATPPVVQTLAQVMADLDPAYAGQTSVIQQKQAGLGAKYDTQRQALTAEKGQGFNAINNQATGRGLSFSGIPLDEQATYLSTKYLPAYAQTYTNQNEEDLTLQGQIADINADKTKTAYGTVQQQNQNLNSWNMQEAQLAAQARENQLNREASARESAANRAASAAQEAGPTSQQFLIERFGSGYGQGDNATNGWTENVLAGQYAATYGLSRKDALAQIYAFRKQYYGK